MSRWHRVDAAELWHWHGGAPLLLEVKHGETRHEYRLGPDWLEASTRMRPVPAQPGRARAAWAPGRLLGCTVAPGFDFAGFESPLDSSPRLLRSS